MVKKNCFFMMKQVIQWNMDTIKIILLDGKSTGKKN